ncbi:MAG: phenylalanine--tRNA ligase subunit alpha [Bacteriovoracaceae bacterium]|nr:phenylalanine--tRNA ligase subunit alpha [Bacteriovoracaceae bacterium]
MNAKLKHLDDILAQFSEGLSKCNTNQELLDWKSKFIGKQGSLNEVLKNLKDLSEADRKIFGPKANATREAIETQWQTKQLQLERTMIDEELKKNKIDIFLRDSITANAPLKGAMHPTYLVQRRIEDIFLSMGFEILDGPHIEDDFHNFTALNIPKDHPARDMQDTFWFKDKLHLLRTHTSTIQIRGMKERTPPMRFVGPGKVFRCERTDATHEMCFHQLEGMMVGENITVSNLIYFMQTLLKKIFRRDMETRLRPGFFPFVEPGFELDIRWKKPIATTARDRHSGWLELLPCGMIHPEVLRAGGIDPKKYSGFAFGLGLDRLVMVNNGINDVRHFHSADLRFHEQFSI